MIVPARLVVPKRRNRNIKLFDRFDLLHETVNAHTESRNYATV